MVLRPVLCLLLACCATVPGGVPLEIPHFRGDDPRVETAGFVSSTRRVTKERAGTRYTLMAFAVGGVVTLGAMVEGPFVGKARFSVRGAAFEVAFPDEHPSGEVPVEGVIGLDGEAAAFRGVRWVQVDLFREAWFADDETVVGLVFVPEGGGEKVFLPDRNTSYHAHLTREREGTG